MELDAEREVLARLHQRVEALLNDASLSRQDRLWELYMALIHSSWEVSKLGQECEAQSGLVALGDSKLRTVAVFIASVVLMHCV
jgi:hypothetical protein